MQLKSLKNINAGVRQLLEEDLGDFNTLIKAEKGLGLRGTKVPKVSNEVKAKAAKMALDSWKDGKGMAHVDTTALRKTLNGMDALAETVKRFGGDDSIIAKAKEEAAKIEEIASLAYSLNNTIYHVRQVRTNTGWSDEHREFAKQMAKELGLK